jgi:hypothetical protein
MAPLRVSGPLIADGRRGFDGFRMGGQIDGRRWKVPEDAFALSLWIGVTLFWRKLVGASSTGRRDPCDRNRRLSSSSTFVTDESETRAIDSHSCSLQRWTS